MFPTTVKSNRSGRLKYVESTAAETITINSVGIGTGTFLAIRSYNIQNVILLYEKERNTRCVKLERGPN